MNRLLLKGKFVVYFNFRFIRSECSLVQSCSLNNGKGIVGVSFMNKNNSDPTVYF